MTGANNSLDPFGSLLHRFRKRRRLTQQQLSEAIGMHRHTISRWENGEVLPASKSIVLEVIRHLDLPDQEARQLLEARLTAPAPLWSVPLPRNLCFTGREKILETLHQSLRGPQPVAPIWSSALHGLAGVGKTQVALEYQAIFWIEAQTRERALFSLGRIAAVLGLAEQALADQQRIVEVVHRWLLMHEKWLLIWDNLEDLHLPHRLLAPTSRGAHLFTTRCQVLGTLAYGIELQPMGEEEGLLLLLRLAKLLSPTASREQMHQLAQSLPAEYAAACTLVRTLAGLPLALDQAGAYLEETGCSLTNYLHHFSLQKRDAIWERNRRGQTGRKEQLCVHTS